MDQLLAVSRNPLHKARIVALYQLGCQYELPAAPDSIPSKFTRSLKRAIVYYKIAAREGCSSSLFNLAVMHHEGKGVPKCYRKAFDYFCSARDAGYSDARFYLGLMYEKGEGVPQSYAKALENFTLVADDGFPAAAYYLAEVYYEGSWVSQSYEKAAKYFTIAGNGGVSEAWYKLGFMYGNGEGFPQSVEMGMEKFELAAKGGHEGAKSKLDLYTNYSRGEDEKVIEALKSLAEEGGDAAAAGRLSLSLGCISVTSQDPKSVEHAIKYFELAAEVGDSKASNEARTRLGLMYCTGIGAPVALEKAIHYLTLAADAGYSRAISWLPQPLIASVWGGRFDLLYQATKRTKIALDSLPPGFDAGNTSMYRSFLETVKSQCGNCGSLRGDMETFSRCSACHCLYYCSKPCQGAHWKRLHKRECNKERII